MWGWSVYPLGQVHSWEGENFGQRIWDKVRWYLRTHWELREQHWEQAENTRMKRLLTTLYPKWTFLSVCSVITLAHAYSIPRHGCPHFLASANRPFTKRTKSIGLDQGLFVLLLFIWLLCIEIVPWQVRYLLYYLQKCWKFQKKKKEFQRRKIVKKNKESFGRFGNILFLGMEPSKWNYYSKQTCVEAALVLPMCG